MSDNIIVELDDENGDDFIDGTSKTILLDFWAQWCSPCLSMATLLEDIAPKYTSKLITAKVNIDDNPSLPTRFSIRSIPTLLILKKGQVIDTHVGPINLSQLEKFIEKNL